MNEIYQLIFDRLATVGYTVYSHVPQGTKPPYIVLDAIRPTNGDTDTERAFDATFQLHCWSDYRGSKEAAEMQKAVYDLLHLYQLADSASYRTNSITQDYSEIFVDPDTITRHGVQRFNIYIEDLPTP